MNPTQAWFGTSDNILIVLLILTIILPIIAALAFHSVSANWFGMISFNVAGLLFILASGVALTGGVSRPSLAKVALSLGVFTIFLAVALLRSKWITVGFAGNPGHEPGNQLLATLQSQKKITLWILGLTYSLHWIWTGFVHVVLGKGF